MSCVLSNGILTRSSTKPQAGGHIQILRLCCKCSEERGQRLGNRKRPLCCGCLVRKDSEVTRRRQDACIQVFFRQHVMWGFHDNARTLSLDDCLPAQAKERALERQEEDTARDLIGALRSKVSHDVHDFRFHHTRKLLNRLGR